MFKLFKSNEVNTVVREGMTLEEVYAGIRQLMSEVSVNHHRMGQFYNHMVKKKLAEKAGYKDSQAWFSKHLAELSQASLTLYGAVAGAFSEQTTQRFGISLLHLLLIYMKAADLEVNPAEPGEALIEVPDDKGQVTEKPFSACSAEDMRKAIKRKRKPSSSKPLPPEVEALVDRYQEAVQSLFPLGTKVTVVVRNQQGKAVLDFKGIPVGQESKLVALLTGELPPVREVRLVEKGSPRV